MGCKGLKLSGVLRIRSVGDSLATGNPTHRPYLDWCRKPDGQVRLLISRCTRTSYTSGSSASLITSGAVSEAGPQRAYRSDHYSIRCRRARQSRSAARTIRSSIITSPVVDCHGKRALCSFRRPRTIRRSCWRHIGRVTLQPTAGTAGNVTGRAKDRVPRRQELSPARSKGVTEPPLATCSAAIHACQVVSQSNCRGRGRGLQMPALLRTRLRQRASIASPVPRQEQSRQAELKDDLLR